MLCSVFDKGRNILELYKWVHFCICAYGTHACIYLVLENRFELKAIRPTRCDLISFRLNVHIFLHTMRSDSLLDSIRFFVPKWNCTIMCIWRTFMVQNSYVSFRLLVSPSTTFLVSLFFICIHVASFPQFLAPPVNYVRALSPPLSIFLCLYVYFVV